MLFQRLANAKLVIRPFEVSIHQDGVDGISSAGMG